MIDELTDTAGTDGRGVARKKRLLFGRFPRPFEINLVEYPEGAEVAEHVDEITCGEHHRLDIVLSKPSEGGEFFCKEPIFQNAWISLFRSDTSPHGMTRVRRGKARVLSLTWLKSAD